jgi:hypothetical protein
MPDDNKRTINEELTNDYRRLNKRYEFNQMIDDFSIRREILNMLVQKVYEGVRNQKRWMTMIYYQLPMKTNF